MFIESLKILSKNGIIRNLEFKKGLNLIIDNTPSNNEQLTGNNVGKTTILKLVYFCFGGDQKEIYTDVENKNNDDIKVKKFLIDNEVIIELNLIDNFDYNSKKIKIERNFLSKNRAIKRINGDNFTEKEFKIKLKKLLFKDSFEYPTLKQLISHNIRYKEEAINNTLRRINSHLRDNEYEMLHLFLLGFPVINGKEKNNLSLELQQEEKIKKRFENGKSKLTYMKALELVEQDIVKLENQKSKFDINDDFNKDLEELNNVKYSINKKIELINRLDIKNNIILESSKDMESNKSNIDYRELEMLYSESKLLSNINKKFEDLVLFHNNMIDERIKFIRKNLPKIEKELKIEKESLEKLLSEEVVLSEKVSKLDSFEHFEKLIKQLNEKYILKGNYETIISQINDSEEKTDKIKKRLQEIGELIYSDEFENNLRNKINKFNEEFSKVSNILYGESYILNVEKKINRNLQPIYEFSIISGALSSGKKQGEILCFDLSYILFADSENIPCMHFLLNDKKELMHNNQLISVAEYVRNKDIQLIVSILNDKLPTTIKNNSYIVVELSQDDKLFKIEKNNK